MNETVFCGVNRRCDIGVQGKEGEREKGREGAKDGEEDVQNGEHKILVSHVVEAVNTKKGRRKGMLERRS